jgi:hypothetical protein
MLLKSINETVQNHHFSLNNIYIPHEKQFIVTHRYTILQERKLVWATCIFLLYDDLKNMHKISSNQHQHLDKYAPYLSKCAVHFFNSDIFCTVSMLQVSPKTLITQADNGWVNSPTRLTCNNKDTDFKWHNFQTILCTIQHHSSNLLLSPILLEKYCVQAQPRVLHIRHKNTLNKLNVPAPLQNKET